MHAAAPRLQHRCSAPTPSGMHAAAEAADELENSAVAGAHCEPMEPMPPPTMPPPCTKGPSLPAIRPAAMENTTPISFATSVLTCAALSRLGLVFQSCSPCYTGALKFTRTKAAVQSHTCNRRCTDAVSRCERHCLSLIKHRCFNTPNAEGHDELRKQVYMTRA